MQFLFQLSVELERSEGKFESRDDLEQAITEGIEDPGTIEGPQYQGTYDVITWDIESVPVGKAAAKPKADNSIRDLLRALRLNLEVEDLNMAKRNVDGLFVKLADAKVITFEEAKTAIR
jgi:hypothetical protein